MLYGGNGPVAELLGFVEVWWTVAFLSIGVLNVAVPYWLSEKLEIYIAAKGGT